MKSYKLIGLTGTTGAGKGETAEILRELGCEIISADFLAREIMKDRLVLDSLRLHFGSDIAPDGALNRALLAERAFASHEKTLLLNRLTHPYISELFTQELGRLAKNGAERIVFDASQLFESGLDVLCDVTIAVTADEKTRINRITARDGIDEEAARLRIGAQLTDGFFRENCDFIIENNDDKNSLFKKTETIFNRI